MAGVILTIKSGCLIGRKINIDRSTSVLTTNTSLLNDSGTYHLVLLRSRELVERRSNEQRYIIRNHLATILEDAWHNSTIVHRTPSQTDAMTDTFPLVTGSNLAEGFIRGLEQTLVGHLLNTVDRGCGQTQIPGRQSADRL